MKTSLVAKLLTQIASEAQTGSEACLFALSYYTEIIGD